MFGIAVASLQNASEAEKERYQALYCGLCFALRNEYGQFSRAALNYDLAFMVMFLDSPLPTTSALTMLPTTRHAKPAWLKQL